MQKYTKEIKEFIANNVAGKSSEELAELINIKFGTSITVAMICSYKKNHKLKSGTKGGHEIGYSPLFTEEMQAFIKSNVDGLTVMELTELLNHSFKANFKENQIRAFKKNHKIISGVDKKFKNGMISPNKGKKGLYIPGSEKGWYKNGTIPYNHRPVGSERIDRKDGYTLIKTAEPNIWKHKHKVLYEQVHGKLPEGYVVTFLDRDKTNIEINNLEAVTMAESNLLTRSKLRFNEADLTRTGLLIVKIRKATSDKRKK